MKKVLIKFLDQVTGGGNGGSREEPIWRNPSEPKDPGFYGPRDPRDDQRGNSGRFNF